MFLVKRIALASIVVLVLVALAGAVLTVQWQAKLAAAVSADWAANEELADTAPKQTVVAGWAIRDAVAAVGSVIAWSAVFVAACVCVSAIALLLGLGSMHKAAEGRKAVDARGGEATP